MEKKAKQTNLHQEVWIIFSSSKRPLRLFHQAPNSLNKVAITLSSLRHLSQAAHPLFAPPNPAPGLSGTSTLPYSQPLLEISPHLLVLMETKVASETLPPTQEEAIFSFIFQGGGVFFASRHSFQIIFRLPSLKNSRSFEVHTG